jgi:hypothetical protein
VTSTPFLLVANPNSPARWFHSSHRTSAM